MPITTSFPLANAQSVSANLAGSTATIVPVDPPVDPPPPPNPDTWGVGEPELQVTLRAQRKSLYAPSMVNFYIDVVGSDYNTPAAYDGTTTGYAAYDPQFHRVEATVFTGETGTYSNTSKLPFDKWKSKQFQYGFIPKHIYHSPGDYQAQAFVYDQDGKWGVSAPVAVAVTNPNTHFTPAGTIPVAADGVYTGAPDHDEANRCTTMQQAIARVNALKGSVDQLRITLKPGDNLVGQMNPTASGANWLRDFGGSAGRVGRLLVDTWDFTATRATVDINAGGGQTGSLFGPVQQSQPTSVKWRNVNWIGTWDSATNTYKGAGTDASAWRRPTFFNVNNAGQPDREWIAADCDYIDWPSSVFSFPGSSAQNAMIPCTWAVSNVRFDGCRDFAGFGMVGKIAVIASSYEMPAGYANRGGGRNRVPPEQHSYQAHAFMREGDTNEFYMRACYVQHSHGWPGQNGGQTRFSVQPGARINDGSTGPRQDKRIWICDSVFQNNLGINGAPFRANVVAEHVLVERPAMDITRALVQGVKPWSTIRNVHLWAPNISTSLSTGNLSGRNSAWWPDGNVLINPDYDATRGMLYSGEQSVWTSGSLDGEIQLIDNTFAHMRSSANGPAGLVRYRVPGSAVYTVSESGSLEYAPNLSSPIVPAGGVTRVASLSPLNDGHIRRPYEFVHYVLPSAVAIGASTGTIPYPNDWLGTPLTPASFTGSLRRHALTLHPGGTASYSAASFLSCAQDPVGFTGQVNASTFVDGGITISIAFNSDGFVITNNSPREWPSGRMMTITLDRGTTCMAADFHPSLVIPADTQGLYRPNTGVTPTGTRKSLYTLDRVFRAGGVRDGTPGTATAGAMAVA